MCTEESVYSIIFLQILLVWKIYKFSELRKTDFPLHSIRAMIWVDCTSEKKPWKLIIHIVKSFEVLEFLHQCLTHSRGIQSKIEYNSEKIEAISIIFTHKIGKKKTFLFLILHLLLLYTLNKHFIRYIIPISLMTSLPFSFSTRACIMAIIKISHFSNDIWIYLYLFTDVGVIDILSREEYIVRHK